MKLSILIPVYNEEKTVADVIEKVMAIKMPNVEQEIVLVDDGSKDKTSENIRAFVEQSKAKNIKFFQHKINQGKGAALRTAIEKATGDYAIIQDADLEYNPSYIPKLIEPIQKRLAEVVFGTRLNRMPNITRDENHPLFLLHYLGNRGLSFITSVLYGQWLTDMNTCYKIFPLSFFKKNPLVSNGFDVDPEITIRLIKSGYKILELPIRTTPRGYGEGKKLNTIRDGIKSLKTIIRYRFGN